MFIRVEFVYVFNKGGIDFLNNKWNRWIDRWVKNEEEYKLIECLLRILYNIRVDGYLFIFD